MIERNLRRHYCGCYRLWMRGAQTFAQILRARPRAILRAGDAVEQLPDGSHEPSTDGRVWLVEIRDKATGDLLRYAGVFPTLKAAVEDLSAPRYLERSP